jgi:hypothetical protein
MHFLTLRQRTNVIPIRPDSHVDERQGIANLAYELWLAIGFLKTLSPEKIFLQAILEAKFQEEQNAIRTGLFLVTNRDS